MSNQPPAHVADERAAFEAANAFKEWHDDRKSKGLPGLADRNGFIAGYLRAARAAIPAGADVGRPLGYFSKNDGSAYHEVDPKYRGEPDVIPLFRAAGAPAETPADLSCKEALDAYRGKLEAVWQGIRDAVEKATGKPCVGEPLDELAAVLASIGAPAETPKPDAAYVTPQEAAMAGIECGDTACGGCNAGEPWCIHAAQPAPASATDARDALDAARWRALLASERIRMIGSAGLREAMANNYAHFGMEIWTRYGSSLNSEQKQQMADGNVLGREWLTKYADIAIEAQRAAMRGPSSPSEAG